MVTPLSPAKVPATQVPLDAAILAVEGALRTLFAKPAARRVCPTLPEVAKIVTGDAFEDLSVSEKAQAGALMRINHVGEVCAQALYAAQGLATKNSALKAHFAQASQEETDHLAWTADRLQALGSRPSLLNPLWYAGAFAMGFVAGKLGDRVSLGFVEETEKQVEAHLLSHLDLLPDKDQQSRAIVAQMRDEEAAHAQEAKELGALEMPQPVKDLMRAAAKTMTFVAYRI
jgi:3-demethoxyubiquinol 3-hydroxylase